MTRPEMLENLAARLSGTGIEFGAGSSPFPLTKNVNISYADRNTVEDLQKRAYFGDSVLVTPTLQADLEEMADIADGSLDFIIASHVIEHTRNPIRALQQAYLKLRPNGQLVLVIPDKDVTFDRDRSLTDLAHLILDFEVPSRDRDWCHYVEFFEKAFPQPDPVAAAKGPFEANHDIHFHTWTFETFGDFIAHVRQSICPWSAVWAHRRLSPADIEFYYVLTK